MATSTTIRIGWAALALTVCSSGAQAADPPGAKPGDDALTCDQIYAEGMAETKREQEARDKKNDERTAQIRATMGLGAAAMATGGMGGTGPAAQKAAEALAARTTGELGTAPAPNARKDRLRQLWTQKQCVRK